MVQQALAKRPQTRCKTWDYGRPNSGAGIDDNVEKRPAKSQRQNIQKRPVKRGRVENPTW
jgi:hypothetical protein